MFDWHSVARGLKKNWKFRGMPMTGAELSMNELEDFTLVPARKLVGTVVEVLQTADREDFQTQSCGELELTFEGIPGERHCGHTRLSGGREPWYPRGTEMVNERQISILSTEELTLIAKGMQIETLEPGWIGGNVILQGLPHLSMLPPRTRLAFDGGAVIRVDGQNAPCRIAGRAIAAHAPGRDGLDLLFPKVARRLRGLVGFVEKPGVVRAGEGVTAQIPEHWLYR